ncbi:MAG: S8 family serine peptidase [Burkholderiales bacterium]|nr:S8 family serine peptidase [Burkholderiales bacterium]
MADDVCLSIRFVPAVAEKVASILYSRQDDRGAELKRLLGDLHAFVQSLRFEVTTTGAATMCIRGSAERFDAAFKTALPPGGWSSRGFAVVDQQALDRVAARLPAFIQSIALQQSFGDLATTVGNWPPPAPAATCLSLLGQVPEFLGADKVQGQRFDGTGVTVMIFDSDFAFDHRFFLEREADCKEREAVTSPGAVGPGPTPRGHGTAMAALVLACAPRARVVGMKLRNGVLLEGLNAALDASQGPLPDIMSISLARDMCDRATNTCWTKLPPDLEHIAAEINMAVVQGITVVAGTGNGDYGFPAAMKQVIAVGGVHVDPADTTSLSVWDGGSAFRCKITAGDCKNRFVPDVCGLAGNDRGAYIVLPVPPLSTFEQQFPLTPGAAPGTGWALFSGTSAATAEVAGVCALILQKQPGLAPRKVKSVLCNTARTVALGNASELSNLPIVPGLGAGAERAAGFGLVDAFAAWSKADDPAATRSPPVP